MRFRNLVKSVAFCALAVCAVPILSSWAYGSLITYSPVSGANFNFTNIQEDPTRLSVPVSAEPAPVFGQPTGGDSLAFPSLAFKSSVAGGIDMADSKLSMTITAKDLNEGIKSLAFSEFGDYTLARISTGSDPFAEAKAVGWVTIQEVNGVAISPLVVPGISGTQFDSPHSLSGSDLSGVGLTWSGTLSFDIEKVLKDNGYKGYATKVDFSMDNTLFTRADAESLAYIAKKGVSLTVVPDPVPEPGMLTLLALSLFGLGFFWVQRKR